MLDYGAIAQCDAAVCTPGDFVIMRHHDDCPVLVVQAFEQ
jgi:hypothetical protein